MQQAFQMLDKDGNGTIDAGEVAELVFMNEDEGRLDGRGEEGCGELHIRGGAGAS